MRVLVACEHSGTVGAAFQARGHEVLTCDLLDTERPDVPHYRGDVLDVLGDGWDLMVAHPPCTDLATSGSRYWAAKQADGRQDRALAFVRALLDAPIPRIAVENPRSIISSRIRPADQLIHPWMFGHGEQKATMLWLKDLPPLRPTKVLPAVGPNGEDWRVQRLANLGPTPDRWRLRSKTFDGIAAAMAHQWDLRAGASVQDSLFDLTA